MLSTLSGENPEAFKLLRCGVPVNEQILSEKERTVGKPTCWERKSSPENRRKTAEANLAHGAAHCFKPGQSWFGFSLADTGLSASYLPFSCSPSCRYAACAIAQIKAA